MVQTSNHWSNIPTSYAILDRVFVPYLLKTKQQLGLAADHPSIIILDMRYGWCKQDATKKFDRFPEYAKNHYPWLKLLFVPAACTDRHGAAGRSGHDFLDQGAHASLLFRAFHDVCTC